MTAEDQLESTISRIEAELRPLVNAFHERPLENGRKMRELLNRDRLKFPLAAARIFNDAIDEKGSRYLVTILWTRDLLISLFVDVTIPQQLCLSMARTAAKVDPHFHHRLSSFLQQGMLDSADVSGEVATRILEILSATMESAALAPLLRKILLHFDPRVRSKATLLIGRGHTGVAAVERLLNDTDPRVRANAVEALWSNSDSRVVPILLGALKDSNNRVIGNAIVGLYYAGSPEGVSAAFELAQHENPVFRGTAAWVMGKTGDPRFVPALGRLLGESSGKLRSIVFTAMVNSRKSNLARSQSAITIQILGNYVSANHTHIQLAMTDSSGNHLAGVPATAFLVSVGANPVGDFSFKARATERVAATFLLPAPGMSETPVSPSTLDELLANKPDAWTWNVLQYSATPKLDENLPDLFHAMSVGIKEAIPTDQRHFIVVLNPAVCIDETAERDLINEALAAKASIHVLSPQPHAQVQRICTALTGSFNVVPPASLHAQIQTLYNALNAFYTIDLPNAVLTPGEVVHIEVHTASGTGKCDIKPSDRGPGTESSTKRSDAQAAG